MGTGSSKWSPLPRRPSTPDPGKAEVPLTRTTSPEERARRESRALDAIERATRLGTRKARQLLRDVDRAGDLDQLASLEDDARDVDDTVSGDEQLELGEALLDWAEILIAEARMAEALPYLRAVEQIPKRPADDVELVEALFAVSLALGRPRCRSVPQKTGRARPWARRRARRGDGARAERMRATSAFPSPTLRHRHAGRARSERSADSLRRRRARDRGIPSRPRGRLSAGLASPV